MPFWNTKDCCPFVIQSQLIIYKLFTEKYKLNNENPKNIFWLLVEKVKTICLILRKRKSLLADSIASIHFGFPFSLLIAWQRRPWLWLLSRRCAVRTLLRQRIEWAAALPAAPGLLIVSHLLRGNVHGCGCYVSAQISAL